MSIRQLIRSVEHGRFAMWSDVPKDHLSLCCGHLSDLLANRGSCGVGKMSEYFNRSEVRAFVWLVVRCFEAEFAKHYGLNPSSVTRFPDAEEKQARMGNIASLSKVPTRKRSMDWSSACDAGRSILSLACPSPVSSYRDGWSPLYAASNAGHLDIVKTLIEARANVNEATKKCGWSPLYTASDAGHLDIVKTLIEAGANVNQATEVQFVGRRASRPNIKKYGQYPVVLWTLELQVIHSLLKFSSHSFGWSSKYVASILKRVLLNVDLYKTIRLRMVQCSARLFNCNKLTQLCHHFSLELTSLVRV
eukprot:Em0023g627a